MGLKWGLKWNLIIEFVLETEQNFRRTDADVTVHQIIPKLNDRPAFQHRGGDFDRCLGTGIAKHEDLVVIVQVERDYFVVVLMGLQWG